MTKTELIKKIAEQTEMSIKDVSLILSTEYGIIKESVVSNNEEVKIRGFMNIKPVLRAARIVRNPKTREKKMSEEHFAVKAKANGKWF